MTKRLIIFTFVFLLAVSFNCYARSTALQEPDVAAKIAQKGQMNVHVFFVKQYFETENNLPLVKVYFGKVRLQDGKFVKKLVLRRDERFLYRTLLKKNPGFRLYIDAENIGMFRYRKAAKKKGRKGLYFEALPIDKDERLKEILSDTKEKASLESLLDMNMDDVGKAVDKESLLDGAINKMMEIERKALKDAGSNKKFTPFLIITRQRSHQ